MDTFFGYDSADIDKLGAKFPTAQDAPAPDDDEPTAAPNESAPLVSVAKLRISATDAMHAEAETVTNAALFIGPADLVKLSANAPADTIVAALDSVNDWDRGDGLAAKELSVLGKAGNVVLALPASVVTGEDWDAASALVNALKLRGASKVTIAETNNLAELLIDEDEDFFGNALKVAKPLTGRRPKSAFDPEAEQKALAKKRAAADVAGARVDWTTRRIGIPFYDENNQETLRPLMDAAARRVVTRTTMDDRNDPDGTGIVQDHDIEVGWYDIHGIARKDIIKNVSDDDLPHPRKWLKRLDGGHGANIIVNDPKRNGGIIAEAIRASDLELVTMRQGRKRTGWTALELEVNGLPTVQAAYLHVGGAITENGNTLNAVSVLKGQEGTTYPDPWDVTPEREREIARNVYEAVKEMQRPVHFGAPLAGTVHSFAGLGVRGMVNLFGKPNSGKTTCVLGLGGFGGTGYGFGGNLMGKFDGTPASLRRLGRGRHDNFITVDDQRAQADPKRQLDVLATIDDLSRRGYEGGAAGFQVSGKVDDEWANVPPDNSDVFIVAAGETPLPGSTSTKERVFEYELPLHVAYRSGNAKRFKSLLGPETTPFHAACLLRWLAGKINAAGGMTEWKKSQLAAREAYEMEMRPLVTISRFAEVGSVFVLGFHIWLDYIQSIGAVTAEERGELEATFRKDVETTIQDNEKAAEVGEVSWSEVLTTLKQILASRETYLLGDPNVSVAEEPPAGTDRRPPLGKCVKARGGNEDYVFINPVVALDLLRKRYGTRISDTAALAKLFAPISLRRENRLTVQSTIFGSTIEGVAIPQSYWNHAAAEAAADAAFLDGND